MNEDVNDSAIVFVMFVFNLKNGQTPSSSLFVRTLPNRCSSFSTPELFSTESRTAAFQ